MSSSIKEAQQILSEIERIMPGLFRKIERLTELVDEAYDEGKDDAEVEE